MKWIKRIVLLFVLLIVVAVVGVYFGLNHIIRTTVQTQATNSLNVPTTLGGADFSIFGGKLSLTDLAVASPQGFTAPKMLSLGEGSVAVTYSQLSGNPIRINSIIIDKPTLVIEQSGMNTNLSALNSQSPKTTDSAKTSEPAKPPMKLIIDDLQLNNATVSIHGIPGMANDIVVNVPSLELKNIGNADNAANGAAIKDVVMQVITALGAKASDSGALPAEFNALLKNNLGDISKNLGAEFNSQLGNMTKSLKLPGDLNGTLNGLTGGKGGDNKAGQLLGGFLNGNKQPATQP